MYSKNRINESFDAATIQAVWEKGRIIPNRDPKITRSDSCGAIIKRDEYGNTDSQFGWEVDHVFPKAKGGGDLLSNLQPLQWENNRYKSDNWPSWTCKMTAA